MCSARERAKPETSSRDGGAARLTAKRGERIASPAVASPTVE